MQSSVVLGDPRAGTAFFRRGWLATSQVVPHDITSEWVTERLGSLNLQIHPALSYALVADGKLSVAILGDAVDLELETIDAAVISTKIMSELKRGREHAVRYIAYLGGRFAVLIEDSSGIAALTDCAGTLPLYWTKKRSFIGFSSHVHLLGEVTSAEVDEVAKAYLPLAREMKTRRVVYVPGVRTPFLGIRPVLPNHILEIRRRKVTHTRYYPFADTRLDTDVDSAYKNFAESLRTYAHLLTGFGQIGLSLTGGYDSRAALAALVPHLGPDTISWTFMPTDSPTRAAITDTLYGNNLAFAAGIPHKVIPLARTKDEDFTAAYRRSFLYTQQCAVIPMTYHDHLPEGIVEIQCMVAEVGTGVHFERGGEPTAERLSYLFCKDPFGETQMVHDAWVEHLKYAPLPNNAAVDYHDLFYWESRIGRWGGLRIQEVDTAHQIVSPYNARAIIEALQGPPLEMRKDKQALKRFVAENAPDLAKIPIAK